MMGINSWGRIRVLSVTTLVALFIAIPVGSVLAVAAEEGGDASTTTSVAETTMTSDPGPTTTTTHVDTTTSMPETTTTSMEPTSTVITTSTSMGTTTTHTHPPPTHTHPPPTTPTTVTTTTKPLPPVTMPDTGAPPEGVGLVGLSMLMLGGIVIEGARRFTVRLRATGIPHLWGSGHTVRLGTKRRDEGD
jgi:hypothetical protein